MDICRKNFLQNEFKELKAAFKKGKNVQDSTNHLVSQFLEAGVTDDDLPEMMSPDGVFRHHQELVDHKIAIDDNRMIAGLSPQLIAKKLDVLLLWDCDPDVLIKHMNYSDIEKYIIPLLNGGASSDKVIERLRDEGESAWIYRNRLLLEEYMGDGFMIDDADVDAAFPDIRAAVAYSS